MGCSDSVNFASCSGSCMLQGAFLNDILNKTVRHTASTVKEMLVSCIPK